MSGATKIAYAKKINKVCNYIYEHLSEDLTVEQLSQVANFSKYHFHRQFSEYTGINVFKFIQLLRLKRASYQLAFNKHYRIIDIAMDANFENPESFSRAFKNVIGQTPSQFRIKPDWKSWHEKYQFFTKQRKQNMEIKIFNFKETKVAVLEHRGAPELVNDSVSTFIAWRKESKLSPVTTSKTFGIAYDDPKTTAPEKFRFDICGSIESDVPDNPQGVITKVIPGGRCAVSRHLGPHDVIGHSVHYLYGEWLPTSGEELRDFPCFFHYLNLIQDVPEHELITDIYLPLQ
ncbi:MAG: AraC family transcriptional regulator [Gammaproteobacteria bacterium]|jgi:AraC family transcriptional regulator